MRAWIFSDLHSKPLDNPPPRIPEADVAIVAGDLDEQSHRALGWLAKYVRPKMRVIFVMGNHEYYRNSLTGELAEARFVAARNGIDLLERDSVTIEGVRFLGCTLWTDYMIYASGSEIARTTYMDAARNGLADHHLIYLSDLSDRLFDPIDAYMRHASSTFWLRQELAAPFPGQTVVISHHAPHPNSVAPRWQGHRLTPAFVSDMSQLIVERQPALWVHGHTHAAFDYHVEGTRVICNPHGYQREATGFRWDLVVDV